MLDEEAGPSAPKLSKIESNSDDDLDLDDEVEIKIEIETEEPWETAEAEDPLAFAANWKDSPTVNTASINFVKENALQVDLDSKKPIDFFNLLLDQNICELIVERTNSYARMLLSQRKTEFARITRWKEVTVEELRTFFGLLMHMGTIAIHRTQYYWKKDPLFNIPIFSANMSRDRFLIILRCLYFQDPNSSNDSNDKFFKIRPLVDYFNSKMLEVYYPGKNLTLDDPMTLWQGRVYAKQTTDKNGVKLFMLTEPDGTILKFTLSARVSEDSRARGQDVLQLVEEKLDVGHSIFVDNYYSSCNLALSLLRRNTLITGVFSMTENFPEEIKKQQLKKGETIASYAEGVMVAKWNDGRDVGYISTEFGNKILECRNKNGQIQEKPETVINFNRVAEQEDRQEQLLSFYPCVNKPFTWYKKIAIHILQMITLNSFKLYKKYGGGGARMMALYDFRIGVIRELLPNTKSKGAVAPATVAPSDPTVHYLVKLPTTANGKKCRRRCVVCYRKKIRKDSTFGCALCPGTPALCVTECFEEFHST